jgi:hypothetical protein
MRQRIFLIGTTVLLMVFLAGCTSFFEPPIDPSPVVQFSDWETHILDNDGCAYGIAMALDSNGKIHILYETYFSNALRYATNASGTWQISTVATESFLWPGTSPQFAIDSNNKVHTSYYDLRSHRLRYATNASGDWQIIDLTADYSLTNSVDYSFITVDANDNVLIIYHEWEGALKFATNASGSWKITDIDYTNYIKNSFSTPMCLRSLAITVGSNDKIHLAYCPCELYKLQYISNASGAWQISTIDDKPPSWSRVYSVVDSDNHVHIVYGNSYMLKYATNLSGTWQSSTIAETNGICSPAIATDSFGNAHIAYRLLNSDGDSLASFNSATFNYTTNLSGTWQNFAVGATDDVSPYMPFPPDYGHAAIVVDSNTVHICYCGCELRYVTGSWEILEEINPTSSVLQSVALPPP